MYLITYLVDEGNHYAGGTVERLALVDDLRDAEKFSRVQSAREVTLGPNIPSPIIQAAVQQRKDERAEERRQREMREHKEALKRLRTP